MVCSHYLLYYLNLRKTLIDNSNNYQLYLAAAGDAIRTNQFVLGALKLVYRTGKLLERVLRENGREAGLYKVDKNVT